MRVKKFLVLMTILIMTISGCTGINTISEISNDPTLVANDFLAALKDYNLERVDELTGGSSAFSLNALTQEKSSAEIAKKIMSKMSYELGEATIDGDNAVVEATISVVDMQSLIQESIKDIIDSVFANLDSPDITETDDSAFAYNIVQKSLDNNDITMTTNTIDINLHKQGNKWVVIYDEELGNDLLGGFINGLN